MISFSSPSMDGRTESAISNSRRQQLTGCRLSEVIWSKTDLAFLGSCSRASGFFKAMVSSVSVPVLSKMIFLTLLIRTQSDCSRTKTPSFRKDETASSSARGSATPAAQGQETTRIEVSTWSDFNRSPVFKSHAANPIAAIPVTTRM